MTKSLFILPIKFIFPQQARWQVAAKEALAQISEYSDAGTTVIGAPIIPPAKLYPKGTVNYF